MALVLRYVENTVQDIAQDIQATVCTVSISVLVIETILVASLETLLEVILVLVTCYIALIAVRTRPIHVVSIIVRATIISGIKLTLAVTLLVTTVHSLAEKLRTSIIRLVIATVPIDAVITRATGAVRVSIVIARRSSVVSIFLLSDPLGLLPIAIIGAATCSQVVAVFFLRAALSCLPFLIFLIVVLCANDTRCAHYQNCTKCQVP